MGRKLLEYLKLHCDKGSVPALILLDLNMPKKDGFETLIELKADANFRTIPVIILTSSTKGEHITKAYDLGASGYIVKPCDLEQYQNHHKKV